MTYFPLIYWYIDYSKVKHDNDILTVLYLHKFCVQVCRVSEEPNPKRQRVQIAHDGSPWSCLDQVLSSTQMPKSKIEIEPNTYLAESLLPRTNDPLIWWQANQYRFPLLASIARTYLASPPTSVPSERVFSTAGDVISEHRSRLLPANSERLI